MSSLDELREQKKEAKLDADVYTPGWRGNFLRKRKASGANRVGRAQSPERSPRGGRMLNKRNRTYKRR
jgi:hypothetical protein